MRHDLPTLLRAVPLHQLIGEYVQLRRLTNDDYLGLCPFHSEKSPSLHVHPERRFFKCFGCGIGGDAIKFYSTIESVSIGQAIRALADQYGSTPIQAVPRREQLKTQILSRESADFWFLTRHEIYRIERLSSKIDVALCAAQDDSDEAWEYYQWREAWLRIYERFRAIDGSLDAYRRIRTNKLALHLAQNPPDLQFRPYERLLRAAIHV